MEAAAIKVIKREMQEVESEIAYLRQALSGKTAIVEISEFPGPIRALSIARMAAEFGAHPIVINVQSLYNQGTYAQHQVSPEN
jgi:nitrogenase molybdenum-iron protein alpha/beta subunit